MRRAVAAFHDRASGFWTAACTEAAGLSVRRLGQPRLFVAQSCLTLIASRVGPRFASRSQRTAFHFSLRPHERKRERCGCHYPHARRTAERPSGLHCSAQHTGEATAPLDQHFCLVRAEGLNELGSILSLEHSPGVTAEAPSATCSSFKQQTGVISSQ